MYNTIYTCTIYTIALYLPVVKCTDLQYIVWWVLMNVYAHVRLTQIKIQSISITSEISLLYFSSQFPPPLPEALTIWFLSLWVSLVYCWNAFRWNNVLCILFYLGFFPQQNILEISYCVYQGCFVSWSSITLHTCTRLFIFLFLNGHLNCFFFRLLWIKLL